MFINVQKLYKCREGVETDSISPTPTYAVRALVVQFTKISQYIYLTA